MSDSFLENSPFDSYLIPGIVLLCVNGIYNFITLYIFLIKKSNAYLFLEIQGILLTGWIIVQMLLLQLFYPLFHIPFLFIGIYFILYSLSQKKTIFNYSLISYPIYHEKNIHFLFYYSFRHFVSLSESTGIQLRVLGIALHHFYTPNRLVYIS
jgi:hypothetical protein